MLDDYCVSQPVAYNILKNSIKNKCVSHAYLIDENSNDKSFNIVIAFIKELLGSEVTSEDDRELLFKKIDDGNYPEIKIIEPIGTLIKKEQIINLQLEFSRMSIEGKRKIYIIRDCEKMKSETTNSILKFLEEPNNNVLAILMTNNFNKILPTIVSRCQIIRLVNDIKKDIDDIDDIVIKFIEIVENEGVKAELNVNNMLLEYIQNKDRDKLSLFFDKMVDIYYDIIKKINDVSDIKYSKYIDILSNIASKNKIEEIINKINYLITLKDSIKNNVNCNLLIDDLVINLGGNSNDSWS